MVEIQFHPIAQEDIKELYDYLSRFSLQYANSFIEGLYDRIEDLKKWAINVNYPIVAIGGINIDNIKEVALSKSANGIAMISDVLEDGEVSKDRTTALMKAFEKYAL